MTVFFNGSYDNAIACQASFCNKSLKRFESQGFGFVIALLLLCLSFCQTVFASDTDTGTGVDIDLAQDLAQDLDLDGWQAVTNTSSSNAAVTQAAEPALQDSTASDQAMKVSVNDAWSLSASPKQSSNRGLRERVLVMETVEGKPVIATPEIFEVVPLDDLDLADDELLSGTPVVGPMQINNMDMFVGELKVVGKVEVTRVAIGNGAIVRAELLQTGELLIIAQAEGSSSLRLWHQNGTQSGYNIRVSAEDPETRVRMERMVRLRVRMVEFRKSAMDELGINWSDDANGPSFAAAGDGIGNNLFRPEFDGFSGLPNQVDPFSTYFGIATDITSRINFLAQNGDAVTLAEPVLSAINGGSASFLAGGEVPFPSQGADGQSTVEFKEYGVRLQIAPRIDSGGNVRTFVQTEISEIDQAVTINGAPGLLTRRAETEVNVRSGETIVISGLLRADKSEALDRVPGLGRLPILGHFFRSQKTSNAVSELVIFVTPEVVEPNAAPMFDAREQDIYSKSSEHVNTLRSTPLLME